MAWLQEFPRPRLKFLNRMIESVAKMCADFLYREEIFPLHLRGIVPLARVTGDYPLPKAAFQFRFGTPIELRSKDLRNSVHMALEWARMHRP